MQQISRTIEADIGRERTRREQRVERVGLGAVLDIAALVNGGRKVERNWVMAGSSSMKAPEPQSP